MIAQSALTLSFFAESDSRFGARLRAPQTIAL
jgi:hypothetical protein